MRHCHSKRQRRPADRRVEATPVPAAPSLDELGRILTEDVPKGLEAAARMYWDGVLAAVTLTAETLTLLASGKRSA
jgi:hypothetical protein